MWRLTYTPSSGVPVDKPFNGTGGWGFEDNFSGCFHSGVPDELTLTFGGTAIGDTFPDRTGKVVVKDGYGTIFYQGVFVSEPRSGRVGDKSTQVKVAGPWWYLDGLTFKRTVPSLLRWDGETPVMGERDISSFNLNQDLYGNIIRTEEDGSRTGTRVNSEGVTETFAITVGQVHEILDYAISQGVPLQYASHQSEWPVVPVLARPVKNVTCAAALLTQMEDLDAAMWFDHTTSPPTFRFRERQSTPDAFKVTRTIGEEYQQVEGFRLEERFDLSVPYVSIELDATTVVNSSTVIQPFFDVWPNPPTEADVIAGADPAKPYPAPTGMDLFYPFTATVSLMPRVVSQISGTVYTEPLTPLSKDWWKLRKETLADAAITGLNVVPGTVVNPTTLANMLVEGKGNYADWMGGTVENVTVEAELTYITGAGSKVTKQKHSAQVKATTINAPNGQEFFSSTVSQAGESLTDYVGMAQIIYESLNARQWEGDVPVVETDIRNRVKVGDKFNLAGGRAEWASMNAFVTSVSFEVRTNLYRTTVSIGPNKMLTPGSLQDRLRAKRVLYPYFYSNFSTTAITRGGGSVSQANQSAIEKRSENPPTFEDYRVVNPADPASMVKLSSPSNSPPNPQIFIGRDVGGVVDSTKGYLLAKLSAMTGMAIELRLTQGCDAGGNPRYCLTLRSPWYSAYNEVTKIPTGNVEPEL